MKEIPIKSQADIMRREKADQILKNYCNFLFRVYLNSRIAEEISFGDLHPGDEAPIERYKKGMGWGEGDAPVGGITIGNEGRIRDEPLEFFQQLFLNGQLGLILQHIEDLDGNVKESKGDLPQSGDLNEPEQSKRNQAKQENKPFQSEKELPTRQQTIYGNVTENNMDSVASDRESIWEQKQNADPIVKYAKTFLSLFQNVIRQKTDKKYTEGMRHPYNEKQQEQIRDFHCAVIEKKIVAGDKVNTYFRGIGTIPIYTKRLLWEKGRTLYLNKDDANSLEFKLSVIQNFHLYHANYVYILTDKIMQWEVYELQK